MERALGCPILRAPSPQGPPLARAVAAAGRRAAAAAASPPRGAPPADRARAAAGRGPARLAAPLIAGVPLTALQTVVALADAQSGMGVPLDPKRLMFVNPDLSIFLTRDPVPGWVGFDITSTASAHGSGLAQSGLRDGRGGLGRAAQTLVVADRPPG